ncbi:MAG: hypothetical protein CMJ74_02165 [Planctomycetaceae bacterium]|nr:hypothetical protein [Planctomycetaceae bacterium]
MGDELFPQKTCGAHDLNIPKWLTAVPGTTLLAGEFAGRAGHLWLTFWSVVVTNDASPSDAWSRFFAIIVAAFGLDAVETRHMLRTIVIAAIISDTVRHAGFALNQPLAIVARLDGCRT